MMKKIFATILLGLLIIITWSFLGKNAGTKVPILKVGDRWTYGSFYHEFSNDTELVDYPRTVTIAMEDFEGVQFYMVIHEYQHNEQNWTEITYMTLDWVILRTEESWVSPIEESVIINTYNPGIKLYDFPLSLGKEWSVKSNKTSRARYWHAEGEGEDVFSVLIDGVWRIVSKETIAVPAGKFDTYVVEERISGMTGKRFWFSPDAKNHVKMEYFDDGARVDGGNVLTSYEVAPQENGQRNLILIIALSAAIGFLGIIFFRYYGRHLVT